MHEGELIRKLAATFRRSPNQHNALFTCDAEIVSLGDRLWGITTDAFSPEEDGFGDANPELIGRNIAVSTLSDLLAAGCLPQFYLHCLDVPPEAAAFACRLSQGVAEILDASGAFMLGGDLGCAKTWRCAATALGPVSGSQPLTRFLPARELAIFVTGFLGDANAAALQNLDPPEFELRLAPAEAIRNSAASCIDTSDGLLSAVWQWHELNPGLRFNLDPATIPYAPEVRAAAQRFQLPLAAFLLGGAGEYELLYAADPDSQVPGATRIGTVTPDASGGVQMGRGFTLRNPPPDPRAYGDRQAYLAAILSQIRGARN